MNSFRVVLIGHGYLGSVLADELHRLGHAVVAVNRGTPPPTPYLVLPGDVTSLESVRLLAEARPDVVVHCASSSRGGADSYRSVFVEGLKNLRTVFPEIPILFTSSSSVYAQTDGSVVDERSPTLPDRETGRLLLEAESLARASGGIALRLAGIYGPGRSVHLKKILEGSATIEEGEPSRFLNQIHRDDAVGAIVHLLDSVSVPSGGTVYNLVDDVALTQRECYEALAAFFGLPVPPTAPPDLDRKRGWTNKIVSNAALRATGWAPRFPSFLDAVRGDTRLVPSIRKGISEKGGPASVTFPSAL